MGKNSHIEWTHHTFNPWWGCSKVSPACRYCYAEAWAKRVGQKVWGGDASRRFFSDGHWREPLKWNREAAETGHPKRGFCASMADVFERRKDLNRERERLWRLIEDTPFLVWLLLTKRPHNVLKMAPWGIDGWPANVWIGTTVENQTWAERRLPALLEIPATVKFLSCEPLLGQIDLNPWLGQNSLPLVQWIIAGGESGPKSRPMHPDWARSLRDFSLERGIAFHFKQWGHWVPAEMVKEQERRASRLVDAPGNAAVHMVSLGKKDAGIVLDGLTYDGVPEVAA